MNDENTDEVNMARSRMGAALATAMLADKLGDEEEKMKYINIFLTSLDDYIQLSIQSNDAQQDKREQLIRDGEGRN